MLCYRFRYPNIILIYITVLRVVLGILHLVGYTDEKALYCTSQDRVVSFEEGSAYCNIMGIQNIHIILSVCDINKYS